MTPLCYATTLSFIVIRLRSVLMPGQNDTIEEAWYEKQGTGVYCIGVGYALGSRADIGLCSYRHAGERYHNPLDRRV